MPKTSDRRVLIVVFDALRPEFLNSDLMPNLWKFAQAGVHYANSRSTYPTETRVNQSAVTTGCLPRRHGIVGNKFVAPEITTERVLNTGNDDLLEAAFAKAPNGVVKRPSLSHLLAQNDMTYASLSTGTPGGGRLINHCAEKNGSFRVAMRRPDASCPAGVFDDIVATVGPLPQHQLPATQWISWGVKAYLEYIEREVVPDVMLLWLCEPDESFHKLGIGSPGSLEAIAHTDREFGRILEAHSAAMADGSMQIIAMSDHGQTTLVGPPLDLTAKLTAAGFSAQSEISTDAMCTVVVDNAGGIWFNPKHIAAIPEAVDWLQQQAWCGPLFTPNGIAGTLSQSEICIDHARAPDISIIMRTTDERNEWGIAGGTAHDASYPVGGGSHGGLSRHELHNVLSMGGAAFRNQAIAEMPAGNVDILPTILSLLGIMPPSNIDGRTLYEALIGSDQAPQPDVINRTLRSTNDHGSKTILEYAIVNDTRYLASARAE